MAYMIDKDKYYKVKGSLLFALQELLQIYNYYPVLQYNGNDDFKTIPMPVEKRDFFIGCLASEFEHIDWEKQ